MDLHDLELTAENLMRARHSRGLGAPELVKRATELLDELGDAPGTELLAYRLRLSRIDAAYEVWPAKQYFEEQQELTRMFMGNLPNYPVHPLQIPGPNAEQQREEEGLVDVISRESIRAADKLTFEPVVDREDVEKALGQMINILPSVRDSMVHRARAYQRMGLTKQAYNFVLDAPMGEMPNEQWGTYERYLWVGWLDLSIRADIEHGNLAAAAAKFEQLEQYDGFGLEEYFFLLGEALIPLATVVDSKKSLARAREFLLRSIGFQLFALPTLRVATFLVKSGLVEEGLSVAEQTDQAIIRPETAFGELAAFFDAVGRAGYGERPMVQYTSPRWQRAAGVDPADPRCATLAETFARQAARPVPPWMVHHDLPKVDHALWDELAPSELRKVGGSLLQFDAVDKQYDPELERFVRFVVAQTESGWELEERPPFPKAYDREDIAALRSELDPNNDHYRIEAALEGVARIVADPTEDDTLRTALALDLLLAAEPALPGVEAEAVRALPTLGNLGPELAVKFALHLVHILVSRRDFESDLISPLLTFASGLAASDMKFNGDILHMSGVMWSGSRYFDSIWVGQKQLSHVLAYPETYDDPVSHQFHLLQMLTRASDSIEDFAGAIGYADQARELAEAIGDDTRVANYRGQACMAHLNLDNYGPAMQLYIDHMPRADMPARQAFPMAAVGVRTISALTDPLYDEYWVHARSQFMRSAEELINEVGIENLNDIDHGILDLPVDRAVHAVIRDTMWSLIHSDRLQEAVDWTTWATQVSRPFKDMPSKTNILLMHAIAVDNMGDVGRAAAIYEIVFDWGLQSGDEYFQNAVKGIVAERAEETGAKAYAEALARME